MTVAPASAASCTRVEPTPPFAPSTTIVCPRPHLRDAVQHLPGGDPVDHHRLGVRRVDALRHRDDVRGVDEHVGGPGTGLHDGCDPLAHLSRVDARAGRLDRADEVVPRDERERRLVVVLAATHLLLRERHARRLDADQHLAASRGRARRVPGRAGRRARSGRASRSRWRSRAWASDLLGVRVWSFTSSAAAVATMRTRNAGCMSLDRLCAPSGRRIQIDERRRVDRGERGAVRPQRAQAPGDAGCRRARGRPARPRASRTGRARGPGRPRRRRATERGVRRRVVVRVDM